MGIAALTLLMGIVGLLWAGYEPIEGRVISIRMFLFFGSAVIAFITPYLLFPDPYSTVLQLGNIGKKDLFSHFLRRTGILWWGSVLFMGFVCYGDLNEPFSGLGIKTFYFFYGTLFFTGLMIYSICRYARSGKSSQYWKESEKGRELRGKMGEYLKYPLDPGSIPSFVNTVVIGGLGMLSVSIGAALYGAFGIGYEGLIALVLAGISAVAYRKLLSDLVSDYYASNAFFNEFFGETIAGKESESKIEVDQLWWVPSVIRSHVWALLLQLDRKFPAGRILFAGHILIWLLSYQRPSEDVMISAWLLFSVFHHVIIVISLSGRYAPGWFRRWIGTPAQWIFTRIWIQFRWILILAVSILFNSLIFGHVSYAAQGGILLFYIGSAALISAGAHLYQKSKV